MVKVCWTAIRTVLISDYAVTMPGDVIAEVLAHHRRVEHSGAVAGGVPDAAGLAAPSGYRRDSLDVLFGGRTS